MRGKTEKCKEISNKNEVNMDQLHVLTSELSFGLFSTLGNCLQIFESLAQDPDPLLDPHREKQLDPDQQK